MAYRLLRPLLPRRGLSTVATQVSPTVRFCPFGRGGEVEGSVAAGYEKVRAAFESNFAEGQELGAQLVIYKDGAKIVDLVGRSPKQPGYTAETLQCVFSSGKNMEAIAVAMLIDRGLLEYDTAVKDVWPEFGQEGKEAITVADVMRHEGGVPFFASPGKEDDTSGDTILTPECVRNVDKMERVIEGAVRMPVGDNPRLYHAITRGFIVNGILRRVDPQARSLGTFIREDISEPLGVTYFCGIPEAEQSKYHFADMTLRGKGYQIPFEVVPAMLGVGCNVLAESIKVFTDKKNPMLRQVVSWMDNPPTPAFNNSPEGRAMEICSAGCYTNARSMAKVNAVMAGGGEVDGVRLMSEAACAASMANGKLLEDQGLKTKFDFTQGGFANFCQTKGAMVHDDDPIALSGLVGWGGWGGSLSAWHPAKRIAISYSMNGMASYLLGGPRTRKIFLELQQVI